MKKILLIDASPRKGGNSEIVTDTLARHLNGCEVFVFKMREHDCRFCLACAACQGKDTQTCVQKDDITPLLPVIDRCDAIVMASPIYNHQVTSRARLFIERLYPFFYVEKENMSNTSKRGKKAALVCSCWGSPREVMERYAVWTASSFSQVGATNTKALVFDGIPGLGEIRNREDYMAQLQELASWLAQ